MPDVVKHGQTHRPRQLGGSDTLPPLGRFVIEVTADRDALDGNLPDSAVIPTVGDGRRFLPIPDDLHGAYLFHAEAAVSGVGSTDVEVMIRNVTQAADMLNSPIVIPDGDFASYPPAVTDIDTTAWKVASGDLIAIDVDANGTDAEGLKVILGFAR